MNIIILGFVLSFLMVSFYAVLHWWSGNDLKIEHVGIMLFITLLNYLGLTITVCVTVAEIYEISKDKVLIKGKKNNVES